MRLTVRQLRGVIRAALREARDRDLKDGLEVSVIVGNRPVSGKIIGHFEVKPSDPMSVGKHVQPHAGHTMWAVDLGDAIHYAPAEEIELVRRNENTILGGQRLMANGDDADDDGENLDEVESNEDRESEVFDEHKYDSIARQLVFDWEDRVPQVSWKAVAKNYACSERSVTGKQLDIDKLYRAIRRFVIDRGDGRDQSIFSGAHAMGGI